MNDKLFFQLGMLALASLCCASTARATIFGNGADGALNVTGTTYVDAVRTTTSDNLSTASFSINVGSTMGFAAGDEILVMSMQGASAGSYTFARISSVAGGSLQLTSGLGQAFNGSTDKVLVQRVPNYTNVTIQNGGTLTASAWNGTTGGVVAFRAFDTVDIQSGGVITADGLGFVGGAGAVNQGTGRQGESILGTGVTSNRNANVGGGGGGLFEVSGGADVGAGGGGGSHFLPGKQGSDDHVSFNSSSGRTGNTYAANGSLFLGSGGGGGAHDFDVAGDTNIPSGAGGSGGGIVFFTANQVNTAGRISAFGTNGGNDPTSSSSETGGGGGGSGGSVFIQSNSDISIASTWFSGGAGGLSNSSYLLHGGVGGHGLLSVNGVTPQKVDLTGGTSEFWTISGFNSPNWTVTADGSSAAQTRDNWPSVFNAAPNILNHRIIGTIRPSTDDDMVGIVLGFNPGDTANAGANFLLLDWKGVTQNADFTGGNADATSGSTANVGLALSQVTGIVSADELWGHYNHAATTGGVTELARAITLGNSAYLDDAVMGSYLLEILYEEDRVQVFIDGVLQFDQTGSFGQGGLGFYSFAQTGSPTFSNFYLMPLEIEGLNIPEPTTLAMWLLLGTALMTGITLRRRARSPRLHPAHHTIRR